MTYDVVCTTVMNMFHKVSDGKASMISDHMAATMRGPWKIALHA
jgi:hypothetical protein